MRYWRIVLALGLTAPASLSAAEPLARSTGAIAAAAVVTDEQFEWLTEKARQITASVRMKRSDGTIVYTPGVYGGLWPRDCYYLVHGAPQFVPAGDIREILRLIFRHQLSNGIVPKNVGEDGAGYVCWGPPPEADSAQFAVLLTYEYFRRSSDRAFVAENLSRLKRAMDTMPRNELGLIWIDPQNPGTPYGFTDNVVKTGSELFCSLLYWEASRRLAETAVAVEENALAEDFAARAALIEKNLGGLWDAESGMYFAASQDCRQIDVWGSAYMVYIDFPDPPKRRRICRYLVEHYPQIVYAGQVRHLPAGQYWQRIVEPPTYMVRDTYQNGAYWGTSSGWVAWAIAQVDPALASLMLGDLIDYYQRFDAYECVNEKGYRKYPGYAASVANPLAAICRLRGEDKTEYKAPRSVEEALVWLQSKSEQMIRASRREMADGTTAFPPQAGGGYEAFWLRDYAYILEGSVEAFTDKELIDACEVFLQAQRADGACVDCVKFDGTPIYQPGYGSMGENPVADGSQFTVAVAWHTFMRTKDAAWLKRIMDQLVKAMNAVPRNQENGLVHIKPTGWDRCPYGFTDTVRKQGDVLFCSLLYVEAARRLADLLEAAERPADAEHWRSEAERVAESIRTVFWDDTIGLFRAATVQCKEPDIWGSAFAVYLDVASNEQALAIARYFQRHYGEIVECGQIRHLPGGVYWEVAGGKDQYQNGGYWATPTGWFVYTLDLVDPSLADQTVLEMVQDFQQRGVLEWIFGEKQGVPNYSANAALPIAGIRKMLQRRSAAVGAAAVLPSQSSAPITGVQ